MLHGEEARLTKLAENVERILEFDEEGDSAGQARPSALFDARGDMQIHDDPYATLTPLETEAARQTSSLSYVKNKTTQTHRQNRRELIGRAGHTRGSNTGFVRRKVTPCTLRTVGRAYDTAARTFTSYVLKMPREVEKPEKRLR